ncbi:MAG: hypothetical protein ACJ79K_16170 [Gemmatimonadaceae bacterium]
MTNGVFSSMRAASVMFRIGEPVGGANDFAATAIRHRQLADGWSCSFEKRSGERNEAALDSGFYGSVACAVSAVNGAEAYGGRNGIALAHYIAAAEAAPL